MYENSLSANQLVVLPGLMCDSRMFGGIFRGFGEVTAIDGFYAHADRIEAMAELALCAFSGRATLLGHSMGGRVALEIVRRAPERVERLILADCGVHPVRPGEADKRLALQALGEEKGMNALVDAWLPPMLGEEGRKQADLVQTLRTMCLAAGIDTFAAQTCALLNRPNVEDVLGAVRCPTLCIVGDEDTWSPPAQHADIAARIPGARLAVVPGAGHMLPCERPEEFNEAIRAWATTTSALNFTGK